MVISVKRGRNYFQKVEGSGPLKKIGKLFSRAFAFLAILLVFSIGTVGITIAQPE